MKKKVLALLLCACMAFSFVALSQNAAYAVGETYNAGDVAAINAMITNNGLSAAVDLPETWDFAVWDMKDPADCRLQKLNLKNKAIKGKIDLKACAELVRLDVADNEITALDITGCDELRYLYCENNKIAAIDVRGCKNLIEFDCSGNQLSSLDLINNTQITMLIVSGNPLAALVPPSGAPTVAEPKNGGIIIGQYECFLGLYTISLEAVPNSGYTFEGWSLPEGAEFKTGSATTASITVITTEAGEITAAFKAKLPATPNTGDNTMLVPLVAIALISAAAIIVVLVIKARKKP